MELTDDQGNVIKKNDNNPENSTESLPARPGQEVGRPVLENSNRKSDKMREKMQEKMNQMKAVEAPGSAASAASAFKAVP